MNCDIETWIGRIKYTKKSIWDWTAKLRNFVNKKKFGVAGKESGSHDCVQSKVIMDWIHVCLGGPGHAYGLDDLDLVYI